MVQHKTFWSPLLSRVGVLALILGLLAMVGFFATNVYMLHQLGLRVQAMRDAGYPATQTEFIAWYGRPDEPNALDTYYKAFGAITPPADAVIPILPYVGDAEEPDDFAPIPNELLALMKEHLAKQSALSTPFDTP